MNGPNGWPRDPASPASRRGWAVGRRTATRCRMRRATTSVSSFSRARSQLRIQLPIGLHRCPEQAFLALRAEKLQGRVAAVPLQGARERMAIRIVIQLPERSLRLAQMFQRGLLLSESLIRKQILKG